MKIIEEDFLEGCKVGTVVCNEEIDINCCNGWGLRRAVRHGQPEVWGYLLTQPNLDVNKINRFGLSALHTAARFNVEDAVLDLLNHPNIELNNLTVKGRTVEQLVGVAAPSCKQHFRDDILQALKAEQLNRLNTRKKKLTLNSVVHPSKFLEKQAKEKINRLLEDMHELQRVEMVKFQEVMEANSKNFEDRQDRHLQEFLNKIEEEKASYMSKQERDMHYFLAGLELKKVAFLDMLKESRTEFYHEEHVRLIKFKKDQDHQKSRLQISDDIRPVLLNQSIPTSPNSTVQTKVDPFKNISAIKISNPLHQSTPNLTATRRKSQENMAMFSRIFSGSHENLRPSRQPTPETPDPLFFSRAKKSQSVEKSTTMTPAVPEIRQVYTSRQFLQVESEDRKRPASLSPTPTSPKGAIFQRSYSSAHPSRVGSPFNGISKTPIGQPVLHKSLDESYSVMNHLDDVIRSLQQTPWPETSLDNYSLTYPQCMGDMQTGDSVNLQSLLLQQQQEEQQQKQQELQKQESQLQLLQQQHELQIHQQKYHEQQHQMQSKQLEQIRQQQIQHDQQQIYHLQQMHHLQEHHQNYQQQHHTAQHHHQHRSQEQHNNNNNNRYQQQVYNPETGQIYFLQLQSHGAEEYRHTFTTTPSPIPSLELINSTEPSFINGDRTRRDDRAIGFVKPILAKPSDNIFNLEQGQGRNMTPRLVRKHSNAMEVVRFPDSLIKL
ncbi:UPF0746 protein DDB_G0281095 isoform X3 [Eurytemora carolleeae]|uniref:UPF0746 protein DDB_G0281095 isoform X3 n=1 Tax=Eurytemora carolleeae TaxID=1294199 RepID=UPI000C75D1B8|nr:UPF0746 protein DDB_G0281095 isoform X3 [Eurytemora carolleeae]|eukprot:XP_023323033.1 UPF0746 protein DDB_G0281095-like isoform X3 [Eurytemora affinis]